MLLQTADKAYLNREIGFVSGMKTVERLLFVLCCTALIDAEKFIFPTADFLKIPSVSLQASQRQNVKQSE